MPPQALAAVATLLSFAAQGNRIEFKLDHGSAELTWVSDSTFRFRRSLDGALPTAEWNPPNAVAVKIDDLPGAVRLRSKRIEVSIQKRGLLVSVNGPDGQPVMTDVSEPRAAQDGVEWERAMPAGVRYYGSDARKGMDYDRRGGTADHAEPFLLSTAGYGEYHVPDGSDLSFDFTAADRYRIHAPRVDYFFYYGPTPKRIFEERHGALEGSGGAVLIDMGSVRRGFVDTPVGAAFDAESRWGWQSLPEILLDFTHGAMANASVGYFDLDDWAKMSPDLLQRARQIGSLVPDVKHGAVELSDFRKQLETFFASYGPETRDKGYPLWHPLPFEFPDDPECAHHADEFMLGDEMLIAPIYDATGKRSLYLPQGTWTNLETNGVEQGRRTIAAESKGLPVFARNGAIVPLDSKGAMALHYFPSLGAEFFLLESAVADWSQVHAAPAGDILRLEIESKVERDYQWVVHHVERPAEVGFEERKYGEVDAPAALSDGTWFYDAAQKNLHVRVRVAAGEDCVIHVR